MNLHESRFGSYEQEQLDFFQINPNYMSMILMAHIVQIFGSERDVG
jgi:hypothetical protein